ncbi:polymorphic toxin-type HINT domain-containing protein [Streptomyces sp. NBRC 110611]|uniref:polymorphic toxin-type HINT domain-containing protein n=1 Tax=Streptomyces sp. NBRC 110611 TaxID=1621259 RepID=UPI000AF6CF0B|nr:polymorphic toxin-type HINT domain-containing protein [Streptomyces sp. NBRC 110611]
MSTLRDFWSRRQRWRATVAVLFLSLLVPLIGSTSPAEAKQAGPDLPKLQQERPVEGRNFTGRHKAQKNGAGTPWRAPGAELPSGRAQVGFAPAPDTAAERKDRDGHAQAGDLPVSVAPADPPREPAPKRAKRSADTEAPGGSLDGVTVEMLDAKGAAKLGSDGPVIKLTGTADKAENSDEPNDAKAHGKAGEQDGKTNHQQAEQHDGDAPEGGEGGSHDTDAKGPGEAGGAARKGSSPATGRAAPLTQATAISDGQRAPPQKVAAPSQKVDVALDYSPYSQLYGGDWGSRLKLVQLPDCAATDPGRAECTRPTEIESRNDSAKQRLTARVALSASQPMMLAASAGAAGTTGSFGTTDLAPSGSWSAGGMTGGFSWTHPIEAPDAPGGPEPEIQLGYSSQSIDGRTASTNNQASWIGEGWDYHPGFIERRYKSCSQDMGKGANNKTKTGDLCWFADSLILSLDGETNELIKDDKTGTWKLSGDDGARTELKKGAANGDNDGEHWVLTTTDGTQYWFGLNRLPGWSAGKPETNSTLTVPVFGNHPGEPCHADTSDKSGCTQAYRWNLDYVVDPHGDAMSLWWAKDTNHYGQLGKADKPVRYDRAGYLTRIDYGQRAESLFSAKAAARVHFTTAERCLPSKDFDCAGNKLTKENAKHWPDVPFDLKCDAGAKCTNKLSPSFWSTKRLTKITTEALVGDAYVKADSWELKHQFPRTDGTSPALWLAAITHTGHTGGKDTVMPPVTFRGEMMDNRVDGFDGLEPFSRYRIHAVDTEHGSTVGVTYSPRECSAMPDNKKLPASPHDNGMRCYPSFWTPEWADKPLQDWFHKYVVTEIREEDNVTDALPKVTSYQYLGSPAWAYDDSELTEDKHRTWSQYRGYGKVRTYTGREGDGKRAMTEELYFRGMHGDHLPDGKKRTAQVVDSEGGKADDLPQYAGRPREQVTYLDEGGQVESATKLTPTSRLVATRNRTGTTPAQAWDVNPHSTEERARQSDGTWLRTKETTSYDEYGQPTRTHDLGDITDPDDDACTTLTYARNTDKWILELESQEKTVTGACDATGGEVVSDTRTFYDGKPFGAAPEKGDITSVEEMTGDGKGYQVAERTEYDVHGRPTAGWDVDGNKTTTAYTPAKGANPTKTVVTNPLGHTETTSADPALGVVTSVVDTNGRRTDAEHDGLGRVVKFWDITRDKAKDSPSAELSYDISKTSPSTVTVRTLKDNGSYATGIEIYDGLLRERQTQDDAVGGERLISDVFHDTHGRAVKQNSSYFSEGAPSRTLLVVGDNKVPHQSVTAYDGLGRPVQQTTRRYGDDQHTTTAEHHGERTTIVPSQGGTVSTAFTDSEGRTTKLREYLNAERSKWNDTSYAYNRKGQLTKVTDPDGNDWTFEYDARGRQIKATDPDAGTTTTTYDKDDRPVTVTDARGKKVSATYDALDRPTSLREGGPDGPKLAEWTYDSLLKGLPAASVRHHGGKEYRSEVTGYNQAYQPTGSQIVIPDSEGKLAGTYAYEHGYTKGTGLPLWTKAPAVGPLKKELLATRYNSDDLPTGLGGLSVYASNLQYSASGELLRSEAGEFGKKVYTTSFYDEHTRQLTRTVHDRDSKDTKNSRIDDTNYTYDPVGNITRIARIPGASMPDGGRPDTQCFTYDALRRMTGAWTATDACAKVPSKENVGGPQPYWHSYGYDAVGNRTKLVEHDTSGNIANDITRTYSYPGKGKDQPRTLTKAESKGPQGTSASTYAYDAAGNMTLRQVGGSIQKLSYDAEGNLAKITEGDKTTENLYDADGERLIHRAADGSTTLYLGDTELTADKDGKLTTTRHYQHPDGAVTVRTVEDGDGTYGKGTLHLQLTDHHGSGTTQVGLGQEGLPVERRLLTPFGTNRGAKPGTWAGNRGFVAGREDEHTGLTQLGAREYDPTTGRFISVDPLIDFGNPQQMNPYAYANNAPVTESDPDGLIWGLVFRVGGKIASKLFKGGKKGVSKGSKGKSAKPNKGPSAAQKARAREIARQREAVRRMQQQLRRAEARAIREAAQRAKRAKANALRQRAKAKQRTANRAAPKRASKYRYVAKQRPKPRSKPTYRPRNRPAPKKARPQGSRQIKREVKNEVKQQVKEQVREAVQPSGCPTANSFVPGTTVLMADGSRKPIEDIKTGDKVLATDPETGETKAESIVATIIGNGSKELVKITVRADGDKDGGQASNGALIATDGHPFWVPDLKKWVDAGDLEPGMWLQTSSGTWVQVSAVRAWTQNATVHNLTVESTHTFYAATGAGQGLLTHNCGSGPVEVRVPDWATDKEAKQFAAYVDAANDALKNGHLSPTGRVSTAGSIRREAARMAARERKRAAGAGAPYQGVAGHAPDAMWLGHGTPPTWIDMSKRVNSSLSGQGQRYPVGYKPTKFVLIGRRG